VSSLEEKHWIVKDSNEEDQRTHGTPRRDPFEQVSEKMIECEERFCNVEELTRASENKARQGFSVFARQRGCRYMCIAHWQ
jgi:hypothetical protein